jgi:hypothetical protein
LPEDSKLREDYRKNMPEKFKHLANRSAFRKRTHSQMKRAAQASEKNPNLVKESGFHGLCGLFRLLYFNFARQCWLDRFHVMLNIIKGILKLVCNAKSWAFTNKKRVWCSKNQKKLKKLGTRPKLDDAGRPVKNDKGGQVMVKCRAGWVGTKVRLELMDTVSQQVKYAVGDGTKMPRPAKDHSSFKGHDCQVFASDVGVFHLSLLRLPSRYHKLLCSLLRLVEHQMCYSLPRESLPEIFTKCVETLTLVEMYLPIYFSTFALHSLLHTFCHNGYIHELGPTAVTSMYHDERLGGYLKKWIKSSKNPYESAARNYSLKVACEELRATRLPNEFSTKTFLSNIPNETQATMTPKYVGKARITEFGKSGRRKVQLSTHDAKWLGVFWYVTLKAADHPG